MTCIDGGLQKWCITLIGRTREHGVRYRRWNCCLFVSIDCFSFTVDTLIMGAFQHGIKVA